ncbi:aspartate aminotransferase family protein, partial [Candidatus Falkowbacteria bacterium CG11_big_fil_rev_8_21_14_0_20_39_10]
VRGQGLMIGLEMKDKRNEMLKALQIHTILAIPAGENVVRFLPPFIIQKKHIDEAITVLNTILKHL